MMAIRHLLWGAALVAVLPVMLVAQQASPGFHSVSCVKVKPVKNADFNTWSTEIFASSSSHASTQAH